MSSLSRFTKVNEDDAFLLGLLHDIGNVIVLRVMRSQEPIVRYDIDAETFDYLCHECHQEFGELIADAWGLPSEVKALISDHHTPPGPDDPLRTERLQLQLTDMINALLGYAPYASYDLLATRTVRDLGLADSECFVALLAELPERIEETITSHW